MEGEENKLTTGEGGRRVEGGMHALAAGTGSGVRRTRAILSRDRTEDANPLRVQSIVVYILQQNIKLF